MAPTNRRLLRFREIAYDTSMLTLAVVTLTFAPAGRWVGNDFWANRLQDWQMRGGKLECLAAGPNQELCTVRVLTREVLAGPGQIHRSARTGLLGAGRGFSGFLIVAGAGLYRVNVGEPATAPLRVFATYGRMRRRQSGPCKCTFPPPGSTEFVWGHSLPTMESHNGWTHFDGGSTQGAA